MNRHTHNTLITLIFSLALVMLLAGCGPRWGPQPKARVPLSITTPPIYPAAHNVKSERPQNEFGPDITFETPDEQSTVMEYYNNLLLKEGWTPDQNQSPNNLYFSQYDGVAEYRFAVGLNKAASGHLIVVLKLRTIPNID